MSCYLFFEAVAAKSSIQILLFFFCSDYDYCLQHCNREFHLLAIFDFWDDIDIFTISTLAFMSHEIEER